MTALKKPPSLQAAPATVSCGSGVRGALQPQQLTSKAKTARAKRQQHARRRHRSRGGDALQRLRRAHDGDLPLEHVGVVHQAGAEPFYGIPGELCAPQRRLSRRARAWQPGQSAPHAAPATQPRGAATEAQLCLTRLSAACAAAGPPARSPSLAGGCAARTPGRPQLPGGAPRGSSSGAARSWLCDNSSGGLGCRGLLRDTLPGARRAAA